MAETDAINDDAVTDVEPVESASLHAGSRSYQIVRSLESGGMATVYLARLEGPGGFGKFVALKRIHPHLAIKRAFVEMFLDEARIAARISHPNVCPVFDFGQVGQTYFLAMDYINGETVSRLMRRVVQHADILHSESWMTIAASVIAGAAEGLHAAHELTDDEGRYLNVVHRDVSMGNIFVSYAGGVQVVDFGIAQARGQVHTTEVGTLKGTIPYMSPEQLRSSRTVDRRSDIWALGVCLWEMLCGQRLFRRDTDSETMFAIYEDPIPPPSSVRASLPAELDRIVMKALTRDVDERYATARELSSDLNRFIASRGESVSMPERAALMARVFAPEKAKKRQMLQTARTATDAVAFDEMDSGDALPLRASTHQSNSVTDAYITIEPIWEKPKRKPAMLFFVGAALVAMVIAALFLLRSSAQDKVAESSASSEDESVGELATVVSVDAAGSDTAETPSAVAVDAAPPPADAAAEREESKDPAASDSLIESELPSATKTENAKAKQIAEQKKTEASNAAKAKQERARADELKRKRAEAATARADEQRRKDERAAREAEERERRIQQERAAQQAREKAEREQAARKKSERAQVTTAKKSWTFKARGGLEVQTDGPLTASKIRSGVKRRSKEFLACYSPAARKSGRDAKTSVVVRFKIPAGSRKASSVRASGGKLSGLRSCIESVAKNIRVNSPTDVGSQTVAVRISFTPIQ